MDIEEINEAILEQYDRHTDSKFSDNALMTQYLASPAVKDRIQGKLEQAIEGMELDKRQKRIFMRKIMPLVIPPGVKANIRGNIFNKYIKNILLRFACTRKKMDVAFEKKVQGFPEIADWVLNIDGKQIVGYNQLDIWNGGAQINRASKYILDDTLHARMKKKNIYIVCIVARKLMIKNCDSKIANIVNTGLKKDRLMWPKGLKIYLQNL